jgi:hypothetical protein
MDMSNMQFWSSKMHVGLGILFILFLVCFVAIVIEETFLGGRRRRKAERAVRAREVEARQDLQ